MWWSRLAILGLLLLDGCGYQPLYAQRGPDNETATQELAAVRIQPIADRTGQQLYNFLRDRLNPRGKPADAKYLLNVVLSERREQLLVQQDETATRTNLILTAYYTLRPVDGDAVLTRGTTRTTTSFDILRNDYATLVSEGDAEARAVRDLSEDIRARLAVFLSQDAASKP